MWVSIHSSICVELNVEKCEHLNFPESDLETVLIKSNKSKLLTESTQTILTCFGNAHNTFITYYLGHLFHICMIEKHIVKSEMRSIHFNFEIKVLSIVL